MFVYVIMPTFAAAAALSALFNPSTGTVDFKVVLRTAAIIAADTKAISFFVNIANDIIEAEVSAAELQALITADDQAAIIYKLKVSPIPPVALVCYAVEQSTSGADTDLPLDAAFVGGLIKLTAKPPQPRQPEVNNLVKVVAASGAANKLDITADVKLFVSENFGGADPSTYNVQVINGNVVSRSSAAIQKTDIDNGYVLYQLALTDVKSEDRILISHNNDNTSGDQSLLSRAAVIIASLKPEMASFTAESGKLDDAVTVYIPLKIKYNVADNIFDRVNVLFKGVNGWAVADYFLRTTDTDNEMLANGFVEFKLIRTAAGNNNPIAAFAKLELAISLSKGVWSSNDKATQSKQSVSKFVVAGAKKFAVTHTSTSAYTAQTDDASILPKHTFTKTYTFPAAPAQIVLVASLLQNGVQVDAKTIVIAAAAVTASVSFDRLASLVKKDDKFMIVGQIKTAIDDANAQFLQANATLGGKAALFLAERVESRELVPQPLPQDMQTALILKEADDFLSNNVTRLFTRFELNQASNQEPYKVASYDVELSIDNFVNLLPLQANGSTRITTVVDAIDDKKLDEVLVLTRYAAGNATSLTPKQLMFIRYRTNHTWVGGGNSTVARDWIVYQYTVSEEAQTPAPVINTVTQVKADQLKINFANGDKVQWSGAATNGVMTTYQPTLTEFTLLDEFGRFIKTHIVNHEGNYAANVDTIISLGPEMLDQYVRVKAVRKYVNPLNGSSIVSDIVLFAEVFVAKKLAIRSIQVVESSNKLKLIADIDFGRTLSSEVTVKAVLPFKDANGVDQFVTGAISYDAVEKRHIIELDKQLDPQGSKYGTALKIYLFASGTFGQLVSSVFPSN